MNAMVAFIIVPLASAFVLGLFGRSFWGTRWASLFTLAALVVLGVWELAHPFEPQVIVLGGWKPPFGISLYVDSTLLGFVVLVQALMFFALWFQHENGQKRPVSFDVLALVLSASAAGLILTQDLFNLFVFLEITGVAAIALATPPEKSPSGVIRYWLLSSVTSLAMLLGIAVLYSATGTLNLVDVGLKWGGLDAPLRWVTGLLIVLGFFVKMEVAPFHGWVPGTYHAASVASGFMLSSVVTTASALGVWRFFTLVLREGHSATPVAQNFSFAKALFGIGALSLIFGALSMLSQKSVKKILAFSTISFMGMVLMAIALGTPLAVKAVFFLLIANALGKGLLFWAAGRMTTKHHTVDLEQWRTLENKPFSVVIAWFLGAATVIGLPLLPGFWGKLHFWGAAIEMGRWGQVGILILVVASAVEAVVLLRVGHHLWEKPATETQPASSCSFAPAYALGVLVFAAVIVWIGLAPGWSARSFSRTQQSFAGEGNHSVVLTTISSFADTAKPHIVEKR